jgi:hypothetical protein
MARGDFVRAMDRPSSRAEKPGGLFDLFVIFAAASLLTRILTLFFPFFSIDEAAHITGSRMIENGILYVDFVDNKPPLLYVFYLVCRWVAGDGMAAVHVVTLALVVPLTALLAALRFDDARERAAAGLLLVGSTALFTPGDMLASNCEILMLLPASAAFPLLRRPSSGRFFLAGVFLGLATLLKQVAGVWTLSVAALVAVLAVKRQVTPWRAAGLLACAAAGFLAPLAATGLVFHSLGAQNELLYWTVVHNGGYASAPMAFGEAAFRFARYFVPFLVVESPLVLLYVRGRSSFAPPARVLLESALLLSLIPAFIGFRFYPHYFIQMLLPLSLLAAPGLAKLVEKGARAARLFGLYAATLFAVVTALTLAAFASGWSKIDVLHPGFRNVAAFVSTTAYCSPGGKNVGRRSLFVWGYAPVFYETLYGECGFLPSSRFVVPQASISGYVPGHAKAGPGGLVVQAQRDLLMLDLERNPPAIIVDASPSGFHDWDRYPLRSFPELDALVSARYRLLGRVDGFDVYGREEDSTFAGTTRHEQPPSVVPPPSTPSTPCAGASAAPSAPWATSAGESGSASSGAASGTSSVPSSAGREDDSMTSAVPAAPLQSSADGASMLAGLPPAASPSASTGDSSQKRTDSMTSRSAWSRSAPSTRPSLPMRVESSS